MIKVLLRNSASNVTVLFIRFGITFVMTPLIVRGLGNYDYGIWEIVIAIIGYMGIMDIGIQPAITKYVAQYNAISNERKLNTIYSSSIFFMALVGFVCLIIFSILAFIAPGKIGTDLPNSARYIQFFLILGIQLLITFPGYVFQCFHQGYQRYHLINLVSIVTILIGNVVLFLLLRKGGGLLTLAAIYALIAYVRYLTYWLLLRLKRFGGWRVQINNFSWDTLKELLSFGFKILMGGIASMLSSRLDSLLIGGLLGPVAVTFYAIPRNLVNMLFNILPAITQNFMPFFSELNALKKRNLTQQVYLTASRYMLGLVFLVGIETYFLGLPFLAKWIGSEYAQNGRFILYLLIFTKLYAISPFQARYLTAIGRQIVFVKFAWFMTLLNMVLSFIFLKFWGIVGVALGTTLSIVIFYPFVFRISCRYIGVTVGEYLRKVLLPQLFPSAVLVASLWVLSSTFRIADYMPILLCGAFSSLLYTLVFILAAIPNEERIFAFQKIKGYILLNLVTSRSQ